MANIQQSMSLTNIQTTVNMSVVVINAQKLDTQLKGIKARIGAFKKSIEDSLGTLDAGAFISGGGLLEPFINGIKKAIKAEDELEGKSNKTTTLKAPEVSLGNTATNLKQFNDAVDGISLKMGQALLPAVNSVVTGLMPLITTVGEFVANNPALIEGLAAAAVAFTVVTAGAMGLVAVMGLLTSPIGIVAAVIALTAGLMVAYWKPISGFFKGIWQAMQGAAESTFAAFQSLFNWKPLEALKEAWAPVSGFVSALWESIYDTTTQAWAGFRGIFEWSPEASIEAAWAPISGFFSSLWQEIKNLSAPIGDFFKTLFSWHPFVIVASNWQPLEGLFSAVWDLLRALAVPAMSFLKKLFDWNVLDKAASAWQPVVAFFSATWDVLCALAALTVDSFKGLFDWSPTQMFRAAWDPVSNYFSGMWQNLQVQAQPMVDYFKGLFDWSPLDMFKAGWEPITEWFSTWWGKLQDLLAPIKDMFNGGFGGFIASVTGKVEGLTAAQQKTNAEGKGELAPAFFGASNDATLLPNNLAQGSNALVQQTAANNRTQLEGGLTVRFDNAPQGLRVDQAQTNQPALAMNSRIGYRSLSLGGSNELA
ncbi:phage tail tape measure protein [Pseudomonas sp. S2_A02]